MLPSSRNALPVLAVLALSCAHGPQPAPPEQARAQVRALEDEYLAARFRRFPEQATRMGWPGADHGGVTDPRPEAVAGWQQVEDGLLARAKAIDPRRVAGSPEAVTLGILVEALEGAVAARPCRTELWGVSSAGGWQAQYASLAEVQPVGTPALNEAAKARLHGLAVRIDREVETLREGARLGYVAACENVDRARGELDKLLATEPRIWPYVRPGVRAEDHALIGELTHVVEREVLPAAQRYRDYLVGEYLAKARQRPSLLSFPDGAACYRGAVRRSSTLDLDPQAVHDTGRARLAAIHAEIRELAAPRFGADQAPAVLKKLREDPALRFGSKEEIVEVSRAAVQRAAAAAPRWFGRVPRAPVTVREYPEFRRPGNPAESYSPDFSSGKLAGIYFINVFDPEKKPRAPVESTAFHEAIPGHHLQMALALEAGGSRLGKYVTNSGFVEGWALYAERLAGEMGLFSDDVSRLGMLSSEAFRAARLVVDSGLAVFGWTRQRAIDYLVENAGLDPAFAASEVDRYMAWPGQATSYMLGALELRRLRGEAEKALGPAFDPKAFHDAVLEDGAIPLGMLRARVERLVSERKAAAAKGPAAAW